MEHTRILEKNSKSNLYIDYDNSLPLLFRKIKINNDGSFEELVPDTLTYNNVFWVSSIQIPNEDCYLAIVVYRNNKIVEHIIIRSGIPQLKVFYTDTAYTSEITDIQYEQYNKNGTLLDSGFLSHIDAGIYYFNPENEFESLLKFFKNSEVISSILKLPYLQVKIEPGTGSGYTSNGLFLDTGFSNFGYIGEKYSYFDLDVGEWKLDPSKIAKAEDLAKAVAWHYNLEWIDRTSPNHIFNYIKYFRTYDEESSVFRLYAPSITPTDNPANFELIQEDELGNIFIKGVSMLLVQDLQTVPDGSVGVYIPFK